MRNEALSNLIKLAVYAAAVTLLAVWLSPVLFQGGMALVDVSLGRPMNRPMDWFANWADGAGFHQFFVLTFLGFSLLLLPPLVGRLGVGVLPGRILFIGGHQRKAVYSGLVGCLMVFVGGVLLAMLRGTGWEVKGGMWMLLNAVAVAFVFEWVFRGVVFGLLEKLWRSVVVVGVSAAVFVGFRLILPPPDFTYADPESWTLGWQMIGKIPAHGVGNAFSVFALMGWGVLLGLVRLRHESLWLPVFLHAAWLVAVGLFDPSAWVWISWGALCAGFAWFRFVRKRHASAEEN